MDEVAGRRFMVRLNGFKKVHESILPYLKQGWIAGKMGIGGPF